MNVQCQHFVHLHSSHFGVGTCVAAFSFAAVFGPEGIYYSTPTSFLELIQTFKAMGNWLPVVRLVAKKVAPTKSLTELIHC